MTAPPITADRSFAREVFRRPSLVALVTDQEEWDVLLAAHARAADAKAAINDRPRSPDLSLLREVDEALRAGNPLPRDFAERQAKARSDAEIRAAEMNVLVKLQGEYSTFLADKAEESIPAMVTALDAELRQIVDQAAGLLRDLGGVINPLVAIEAGRTEAFRALADLHRQYLRVRSDADLILGEEDRKLLDGDRSLHRIMRGVARVWPSWRAVVTERGASGWSGPAGPPWPADADSLEFFQWLVSHAEAAQPWVPSADALRAQKAADGRADEADYQARHSGPDEA